MVTLILIISVSSFGQARLGSSAKEIKQEFADAKYALKENYGTEGVYSITLRNNLATVIYYFDSEKICGRTIIIPDNEAVLNAYVENYNKNYVVINDTKWKMYSNDGISYIELVMDGKLPAHFKWE